MFSCCDIMMISKAAFTLFAISNVVSAWAPPVRRHVVSSILRQHRGTTNSIYYGKNQYGSILATQLHSTSTVSSTSSVSTEVVGAEGTESFRLLFKDAAATAVSPWHNIPMKNEDGTYNMVRFLSS